MARLACLHVEPHVSARTSLQESDVKPRGLTLLAHRWYMEDCERLWYLQPLKNLKEHPMNLVVSIQDVSGLTFILRIGCRRAWVTIF